MTLWRALCKFLPLLAVMGLVLAPLTARAGAVGGTTPGSGMPVSAGVETAGSSMAGMSADMPCCPQGLPALPDCQKGCPLASLCLAKCFGSAVTSGVLPLRIGYVEAMILGDDVAPDSLAHTPPPKPPRA